jgi:flagella basal body P-ring formation protein FlgA
MLKHIFKITAFSLLLLFPIETSIAKSEVAISKEAVADKMKSAIRDYLSARFQKDPIRIQVKGMTPILVGKIISNEDTVAVTRGPEVAGSGFVGRKLFLLSVTQNSGKTSEHWIAADVSVARKVLIADRAIRRKERIDPESLVVLTFDQVHPEALYIETSEELLGKQAVRMIPAGVPITRDMVEDAPVMSRGDRVILFAESEGMVVSVSARTKEEGFLGKQVAVVPVDGSKTIYGTVVGPSKVKVEF